MKATYTSLGGFIVFVAPISQELYRTKSMSTATMVHEIGPSLIISSPIRNKVSKYKEKAAVSPKSAYYRM